MYRCGLICVYFHHLNWTVNLDFRENIDLNFQLNQQTLHQCECVVVNLKMERARERWLKRNQEEINRQNSNSNMIQAISILSFFEIEHKYTRIDKASACYIKEIYLSILYASSRQKLLFTLHMVYNFFFLSSGKKNYWEFRI